jgi:uncharacterized protein YprB with RNaseH-like and TPR domain/predicted nuclease with RNAse H fold/dephospho-CoA kinase
VTFGGKVFLEKAAAIEDVMPLSYDFSPMLSSTFIHLAGIGAKTERGLWSSGVMSWEDFESRRSAQLSLFTSNEDSSISELADSKRALLEEDADFFARSLPKHEHYRIALSFPSKTLFLDIETTGLSQYYDAITLIGWSIDDEYSVYIKGDDPAPLIKALSAAKAVVTFNGSLFDVPFLRSEFADLPVPTAHIDLRFLAKRVGYPGGQKHVEASMGWQRFGALAELRGGAAPLLWHKYRRGDTEALELLLAYNYADIQGMKHIFDVAVDRLLEVNQLPLFPGGLHRFSKSHSAAPSDLPSNAWGFVRPYVGQPGSVMTLHELNVPTHRVVGIDLTGSESRPSGWCLIQDGKAMTRRICSDEELIQATMEMKPDLISIDSPLSLPKGRITVTDDDPGRQAFGITRECERILKKRGVNVYPSLIQSMQALTARGIRLAKHFRNLGVSVIESYPGAAQDIMNIPRKRADLALLKAGLAEFGISGDFKNQEVSHDELDAITSGAVGLFFMSGNFEALGNDEEEFLIIPDIKRKKSSTGKRKVVGLSGPISSGKTAAGKYLESRGFAYGRYSQVLQHLLQERGVPVTRESLQQVGEEVYEGRGQRWLGSELIKRMPEVRDLVIDGLRHPEDHSFLIEMFGADFLHIHIDAPESIRRKRYLSEGPSEEFTHATAHPVEANIPKLAELAHMSISNTAALDAFLSEILDTVNNKFGKEGRITCQ